MQYCAGEAAHLWVEDEPAGLMRLCARCARFSQSLQDAAPLLFCLHTHLLLITSTAACSGCHCSQGASFEQLSMQDSGVMSSAW